MPLIKIKSPFKQMIVFVFIVLVFVGCIVFISLENGRIVSKLRLENGELKVRIDDLNPQTKISSEQNLNKLSFSYSNEPQKKHPIFPQIRAEIFLSSGPRKNIKNEDTELGEDIAGIIQLREGTVFFIFDGTSDSDLVRDANGLDIFSSRLLGQTIANSLRQELKKKMNH